MRNVPQEMPNALPAAILDYPRLAPGPLHARTPPPGQDHDVDTSGWDTVFSIPIQQVNRVIALQGSSPPGFRYKIEDKGRMYACEGSFGDWWICPGGDGQNIHLALPITRAIVTYPEGGKTTTTEFRDLTATLQFKLKLLPHTEPAAGDGAATPHDLVIRDTSSDTADPVASMAHITPKQKGQAAGILSAFITHWCNENAGEFSHVFATIDINKKIDKEEWAFCKPSYTTYAYVEKKTAEESCLAVLCMTGGRQPGDNIQWANPFAIPEGSEVGFLISRERLLKDLLLPTFPNVWAAAKPGQFVIGDDNRSIELASGQTITLEECKHKGKKYTPVLKKLNVELAGKVMTFTADTDVEISPGVTGWCHTEHRYRLELGSNENGQTLVYREDPDFKAVVDHGAHKSEFIKDLEWVLGTAALLAGIIAIFLTGGWAVVFEVAATGLMLGFLGLAAYAWWEDRKERKDKPAPSIDLLAFNAAAPIRWAGGKDFRLDFASLNGALQLGGSLFTSPAG